MILRSLRPSQGIKFAWLPVWTDEGKVWLEFVHYRWNATEFGSYTYRRWISDERYDEGYRAWDDSYDPKYPPGTHVSVRSPCQE
jgi:hypothetical protein